VVTAYVTRRLLGSGIGVSRLAGHFPGFAVVAYLRVSSVPVGLSESRTRRGVLKSRSRFVSLGLKPNLTSGDGGTSLFFLSADKRVGRWRAILTSLHPQRYGIFLHYG